MKYLKYLLLFLVISCKNKSLEESKKQEEKEEFEMYKPSEMAILMEKMYVENQSLKECIENNKDRGHFPEYFLEIQKAEMTKGKERDAFFTEHAEIFLKEQSEIYKAIQPEVEFNQMVDACIKCHETACQGPIDRIKKLYIR